MEYSPQDELLIEAKWQELGIKFDAFYTGSDMLCIMPGEDTHLIISPDFFGQKPIDLVDKLGAWFKLGDTFINPPGGKLPNDLVFAEGRALFTQNRVYVADAQYGGGKLRNADWEYGIIPNPLYDADQEDYITLIGNPFTLWCVMRGARNASMSTAVMEVMGSEGYRKTSPALFENNMKYRYTPDPAGKGDSARMFDIIRENINFDLGRLFSNSLSYMSEMPSDAAANGSSWATIMKQQKVALTRAMNSLNKSLEKIVD